MSVTKDELSSRFKCITPPIYLGHINRSHYFSAGVEPNGEEREKFTDLRHCSALLSDVDNSLLGYALTLQAWQKNYQYCGLCGSPNLRLQGGHILRCSNPEWEDARWISRKEIIAELSTGKFVPPTSISISFRLIEDWFNIDSPVPFRMLCENNKLID